MPVPDAAAFWSSPASIPGLPAALVVAGMADWVAIPATTATAGPARQC